MTVAAVSRRYSRVSIVIPCYNSAPYLRATLDSVRGQTLADWELVIVDDGSTDDTPAIATELQASDGRVRVLTGANVGVAAARNRGFAATDPLSDFVIFLDHDDVWECDALQALVDLLDAHPEYVSAHGIARSIDEHGQQPPGDDLEERLRDRRGFRNDGLVRVGPHEPTTFADLMHHNWIVTPGIHLVRRTVAGGVGGFDPETVPFDDWFFAVQVSRQGDIAYLDRPILQWRRHSQVQSNYAAAWRQAHYRTRAKVYSDPLNTPEQFALARRWFFVFAGRALTDAWFHARGRRYRDASHQVARAASTLGMYAGAAIEGRAGRRRRA